MVILLMQLDFTLLLPSTRGDLNEILGSLLLKSIGFMTPETFQVKTDINGVKAVMIFQEVAREKNYWKETIEEKDQYWKVTKVFFGVTILFLMKIMKYLFKIRE